MKKNILILTYCSKEYMPLAEIVLPARKSYCKRHGYNLYIQDKPITGRGSNWDKIVMILRALKHADIVVWNGVDVLFMNEDVKVENIVDIFPNSSAILATDHLGVNSDNMIFMNDVWSEQYLTAVDHLGYHLYKDHVWAEQEALIRFSSAAPYVDKVAFAQQNIMNSYINSEYGRPEHWPGNYKLGDWLVHLPGLPFARRIELARKFTEK